MAKTLEELSAEIEELRAENKELTELIEQGEQGERKPRTTAQILGDWKKKLQDESDYAKQIEKDFV